MAEAIGNSGSNVLGILGVLFVGLKLGGVISWSWWWVTVPFWGGLALFAAFAIVVGVIALVAALRQFLYRRRRTLGMRTRP